MPKIIEIDPIDLFTFKYFSIYFISSIFCLLFSLTLLLLYIFLPKNIILINKKNVYENTSNLYLYFSLSLNIINIMSLLYCILINYSIFKLEINIISSLLYLLILLSMILLSINCIYITNRCKKDQYRDINTNKCINICPSGELYDEIHGNCKLGCDIDHPCPDGYICKEDGKCYIQHGDDTCPIEQSCGQNCCENSTDVCINNQCCSNLNICDKFCCKDDEKCITSTFIQPGTKYCCKNSQICNYGKSCCLESDDCYLNNCISKLSKCENGSYCPNGQYCCNNKCCEPGNICSNNICINAISKNE